MAMFAACQGVMTVASRIVYSFARDRGFAGISTYLERVHPTLMVPAWSIVFSSAWVVIFGLICEFTTVLGKLTLQTSARRSRSTPLSRRRSCSSRSRTSCPVRIACPLLRNPPLTSVFLSLIRGHKTLNETKGTWSLGIWRREYSLILPVVIIDRN